MGKDCSSVVHNFVYNWFARVFIAFSWICLIHISFDVRAQQDEETTFRLEGNIAKPGVYTQKAFDLYVTDTMRNGIVELVYAQDSLPLHYRGTISTPVCDDGLCQILELGILWDLIGNYMRFDTLVGMPLTKYDHLPFVRKDYEKLDEILANPNAILERKSLSELFDTTRVRQSYKVDAVTGATAVEVKNSVVEGALYSSYTLWHIANGSVKIKIQKHTKKNYSPLMAEKLIKSGDYRQQLFALKLFDEEDFADRFADVCNNLMTSNPLLELYILKKLPVTLLKLERSQEQLIHTFPKLTTNGRSMLIARLQELDTTYLPNLVYLSGHINLMTIHQLNRYFDLLKENRCARHDVIVRRLETAAITLQDKSFYIGNFLRDTK